jgi:hypothetical protein
MPQSKLRAISRQFLALTSIPREIHLIFYARVRLSMLCIFRYHRPAALELEAEIAPESQLMSLHLKYTLLGVLMVAKIPFGIPRNLEASDGSWRKVEGCRGQENRFHAAITRGSHTYAVESWRKLNHLNRPI